MKEQELVRCQTCLSVLEPEEAKCSGCGVELTPEKKEKKHAEPVVEPAGKPGRPKGSKNWVKKAKK